MKKFYEYNFRDRKEIENMICPIGYHFMVMNEDPRFNDCLFYPD